MPKRSRKSQIEQKLKDVTIDSEMLEYIESILAADDEEALVDDEGNPLLDAQGNQQTAFDNAFADLVLMSDAKSLASYIDMIAQRELEALNLFEPMPKQKKFLNSKARIRLVLGGNRSGKTLVTHVELAKILTNQKEGYSPKNGNFGDMYLVGKDLAHIGGVCWKKLTDFGPFQIIRDPQTHNWRAFRPNEKWDSENSHLAKPAPPLIPYRFYSESDIAWEERKSRIPKGCRFHSFDKKGNEVTWQLNCLSSNSKASQGWAADVGAFDEEVIGDQWFQEMIRGLTDRGGFFIWGATAQHSTEILYDLYQKATNPKKRDPRYDAFVLDTTHNEFLRKEDVDFLGLNLTESQKKVRLHGGFALDNRRVYPEFDPDEVHGIDAHVIPADWTIYVAVDPGRQRLAILFVAIPPPTVPASERFVEVFAEAYIERGTAGKFGRAMKRILGDRVPEAIYIDHRMGRQAQMTTGETVEYHYSQELKRQKIRARRTGYGFMWGSTDKEGRENSMQRWLRIRGHVGQPILKVHRGKAPFFCWEMSQQFYKGEDGKSVRVDRHNHLVTCAEYLAAAKLKWHKPEAPKAMVSEIIKVKNQMDSFFSKSEEQSAAGIIGPRGNKRKAGTSAAKFGTTRDN